jgi:hypothetical protein
MALIIDKINTIENSFIEKYKNLKEWQIILQMNKEELSQLLLKNYAYSSQFFGLIEAAFESAKKADSKNAFGHILREEQIPENHIALHKKMLGNLGLSISQRSDNRKTALDKLISKSKKYASFKKNDKKELAMLFFYRLGSEILAGELYRNLQLVIPKTFKVSTEEKINKEFNCLDNDILFITLHAEHDCKTTDIGIMADGKKDSLGSRPHADYFNRPIALLVSILGEESVDIAKKAYEESFLLRKNYIQFLTQGLW